jgi:hypothetical protein
MHQESQYFWSDFPPGAEVHQRLLSAVMPTPEDYRHKKGQHRYRPLLRIVLAVMIDTSRQVMRRSGRYVGESGNMPGRIINGSAAGDSWGDQFPEMATFRLLHLVTHLPEVDISRARSASAQSHHQREEYHRQLFQIES